MAHVLAQNAKLYRNTGTNAAPTWNEIPNVKDLTLSMEKDETDVTTRASGGWKEFVDGLIDGSVEFSMLYDNADDDFTALQTAFFAKTPVEVAVMDGIITGAGSTGNEGLRAFMMVKSFTRNENLGEALMVDVSLRPCKNSGGVGGANVAPSWYTVP
jgi:predicted secreted protein